MGSSFAALKCFKVRGLFRSVEFSLFAIATSFFTMLLALVHHPLSGKTRSNKTPNTPSLGLRFVGLIICGVGGTCVSTWIMESIFPA